MIQSSGLTGIQKQEFKVHNRGFQIEWICKNYKIIKTPRMSDNETHSEQIMLEDQSYEQIYTQNLKSSGQNANKSIDHLTIQDQLPLEYDNATERIIDEQMLDENDEIQMYADQQSKYQEMNSDQSLRQNSEQNQIKTQNQPSVAHNQENQIERTSSNSEDQNKQDTDENFTNLEEETQQLREILKNKYGHFDQQVLIKMLYQKSNQTSNLSLNNENFESHLLLNDKNAKKSIIQQGFQRQDLKNIKKVNHTVKTFVQHGYGISIARKYSLKGQTIQPNPYNNLICKMVKDAWKTIETQMSKHSKIKSLSTQNFNQIKTPLVNSRTWMKKQYLDIFNSVILYSHQLKTEKPSFDQFKSLYNYLIPKTKPKKYDSDKSFTRKSKSGVYKHDQSSQQFKPPRKQKFTLERYQDISKIVKDSIKQKSIHT